MESRNRTFLFMLTAVVITVAVFSSFGLNLFGDTPQVYFPASVPTAAPDGPDGPDSEDEVRYVEVEVTTRTVQSVIAALTRPERYARTVTVSTFRPDGTEDAQISRVLAAGGWTGTETQLPGGGTRYTVVGDGSVYRWYDGDKEAVSWPADGRSADVEGQRLPTYETVLELAPDEITDAGYTARNGVSCIYVETLRQGGAGRERYYIAVENGLLSEAESLEGERVIYRMTAGDLEQPAAVQFALPDGTVLYAPG